MDSDRHPGVEEILDDGTDQDCDGVDQVTDFSDDDLLDEGVDLEEAVNKEAGCPHHRTH